MKRQTDRAFKRESVKYSTTVVPERNIDRYYKKWRYKKQPKLACNLRWSKTK